MGDVSVSAQWFNFVFQGIKEGYQASVIRVLQMSNIRERCKGFSLKLNPDCKWSRSVYKMFKPLQEDGNHMVFLNRDDHRKITV